MKKFSTVWKASKNPGKQRKYAAKAPLHLRRKFLSANLSKELRKKYGKRNIPIRKGDLVKVMRGKFKKKIGKIIEINVKRSMVEIEGIQVKKQDSSKTNVRFNPSVLQITELNIEDKKRMKNPKSEKTEENKKNKNETRPSEVELEEKKNAS